MRETRFSLRVLMLYVACWAAALAVAAPVVRVTGISATCVVAILAAGILVGRLCLIDGDNAAGLVGAAWGAPLAVLAAAIVMLGFGMWLLPLIGALEVYRFVRYG